MKLIFGKKYNFSNKELKLKFIEDENNCVVWAIEHPEFNAFINTEIFDYPAVLQMPKESETRCVFLAYNYISETFKVIIHVENYDLNIVDNLFFDVELGSLQKKLLNVA